MSLRCLLQAAPAQAADQQLMDIDGTVLVMLGLFLVLAFILTKWLWKPYLRVRDERVKRVEGARGDAEKLQADAAERLARIEAQVEEARRGASAERAKARTEAQAREQQIISDAQAAAHRMLTEARAKLDASLAAERSNLTISASRLGRDIAEKALGRRLAS